MPTASAGHAATVSQPLQPSQMDQPATKRLLEESIRDSRGASCLPVIDDDSLEISGASRSETKRIDKKSMDYLIRSGVAGGVAGCAVSITTTQRLSSTK